MSKNTGGPAFPNEGANTPDYPIYDGMTLRDWFAAKALPMAWELERDNPTFNYSGDEIYRGIENSPTYEGVAHRAYLMADAMLAERENQS